MTIEWEALEERVKLGAGKGVPPEDPAAFRGRFANEVHGTFLRPSVGLQFRVQPWGEHG
jgi:hypothetical protein